MIQVTPSASVRVGGQVYSLRPGDCRIGDVAVHFACAEPAPGFYDFTVTLQNEGAAPSPRVSELCGLDLRLPVGGEAPVAFATLRGDDCSKDSFTPFEQTLAAGDSVSRRPFGGRSSDTDAFPYFDVASPEGTLVCGIGWSGAWQLTVCRDDAGVSVRAGQAELDVELLPGERIRSSRILLYWGAENVTRARQQFVACHRRFASPFAKWGLDFDSPIAMQAFDRYFSYDPASGVSLFESEEGQLRLCEAGHRSGFDTLWLDACWFLGTFRTGVGNYSECSAGFPNGLSALADSVHQKGMKLVLWFEPERALAGTEVWRRFEHDEKKLVRLPDQTHALVNLGDEEVRQWVYERISAVIEKYQVDCYRQDFNFDPLPFLRSLDTEGRRGMAEMRFVEGIYRLWDALLARFPRLFIDDCASGGRLLDVETCSRAVSLWECDVCGWRAKDGLPSAHIQQNLNLALSRYLPHHQGGTFTTDAYTVRSAATFGIAAEFAFLDDDFDVAAASAATREVRLMSRYWKGDFTPLSEYSKRTDTFSAYALRLGDGEGMVAVFRRPDEPTGVFPLHLDGMAENADYRLTYLDEDRQRRTEIRKGAEFASLPLAVPTAPGSLLLLWEKV